MRRRKPYRAQLLNSIAHELNTPLTPIRLHLLFVERRMGDLDTELQEAFLSIQRNVERLHSLIQDVLRVAALENGRFPVRMADIDLAGLVRQVCRDYRRPAHEAGLYTEMHGPADLWLVADCERIVQIMDHLLRNAIRHTPEGGRIDVRVSRQGHWAHVEVTDTGTGFGPQIRGRLFEPFSASKVEEADTHEHPGLGLYVSKGIVELHGGRIWARSAGEGRGSTFGFRIPIEEVEGVQAAERVQRRESEFSQRVRNLV